jgi:hypothetical protein
MEVVMDFENSPIYVLILGFVFLVLILAYLLALLLRLCSRIAKVPLPGWGTRYVASLVQVVVGVAVALMMRTIGSGPYIGIGIGLGVIILTGLFFYKFFFKLPWAQALKLWGVAAAFQVFLLPMFTVLLIFGLMTVLLWIFPPQFWQ